MKMYLPHKSRHRPALSAGPVSTDSLGIYGGARSEGRQQRLVDLPWIERTSAVWRATLATCRLAHLGQASIFAAVTLQRTHETNWIAHDGP